MQKIKWVKTQLFGIIILAVVVTAALTKLVDGSGQPQ